MLAVGDDGEALIRHVEVPSQNQHGLGLVDLRAGDRARAAGAVAHDVHRRALAPQVPVRRPRRGDGQREQHPRPRAALRARAEGAVVVDVGKVVAHADAIVESVAMPALSDDLLRRMHAYWRAANYLSVG